MQRNVVIISATITMTFAITIIYRRNAIEKTYKTPCSRSELSQKQPKTKQKTWWKSSFGIVFNKDITHFMATFFRVVDVNHVIRASRA